MNYLLASQKHKHMLEDMTMVFWAMDTEDKCEDLFSQLLFGESDTLNAEQTEEMLKKMMEDAREGKITAKRLENLSTVDPSVDFYMLGLKPNSSRLSVKLLFVRNMQMCCGILQDFNRKYRWYRNKSRCLSG